MLSPPSISASSIRNSVAPSGLWDRYMGPGNFLFSASETRRPEKSRNYGMTREIEEKDPWFTCFTVTNTRQGR